MNISADFNPVGASFEDLYGIVGRSRKDAPVFYSDGLQAWVVNRYDDIMELLENPVFTVEGTLSGFNYETKTEEILSTGINWNNTAHIAGVEGSEHTRLKKILLPVLAPNRLRTLEPVIKDIANNLIDGFAEHKQCEFIHEFCYLLPLFTIFRYIGFREDEDDLEQLGRWSGNTFKIWLTPMTPEEQYACARDAVDYQNYMRAKINERRQKPRDDLMTEMVQSMDKGEIDLNEDELVLMFIFTFIGAGHETTMAQIGNALYQLLHERKRWQLLIEQPDQIEDIVEELIRYDGSVINWYRRVAEDTNFKGFSFKKGDFVLMGFGSGNHDEGKFENAESYCPIRPGRNRPLTFSQGRHFCLGAPLARLELKVVLLELARRLPELRLKAGQKIEMVPSVATRSIKQLMLEW